MEGQDEDGEWKSSKVFVIDGVIWSLSCSLDYNRVVDSGTGLPG